MEKFGKINKEYTLLNPPLGKGYLYNKKIIILNSSIHALLKLLNRCIWRSKKSNT